MDYTVRIPDDDKPPCPQCCRCFTADNPRPGCDCVCHLWLEAPEEEEDHEPQEEDDPWA